MKPVSRINQSADMPSMADAIGRETSSGGHIVYLDNTLSRVVKPLRLRTVMRALGYGAAKRDAAIIAIAAWGDRKAKAATSAIGTAVVVAVAAIGLGLITAHPDGDQGPLQAPRAANPALASGSLSKPAVAPLGTAGHSSASASSPAAEATSSRAQATARAASPASVPVPSSSQVVPSPRPGSPSTPPPTAPSTPLASPSGSLTPLPSKGGICVRLRPVVHVCVR